MQSPPVRIGTRGCTPTLVQARWTLAAVTAALGEPFGRREESAPLVVTSTAKDRIRERRLLEAGGGKALFLKAIEQALPDEADPLSAVRPGLELGRPLRDEGGDRLEGRG